MTYTFEVADTSKMTAMEALIYMCATVKEVDYRCVPGQVKSRIGEDYRVTPNGSLERFSPHRMEWGGAFNLHHEEPFRAIEESAE